MSMNHYKKREQFPKKNDLLELAIFFTKKVPKLFFHLIFSTDCTIDIKTKVSSVILQKLFMIHAFQNNRKISIGKYLISILFVSAILALSAVMCLNFSLPTLPLMPVNSIGPP